MKSIQTISSTLLIVLQAVVIQLALFLLVIAKINQASFVTNLKKTLASAEPALSMVIEQAAEDLVKVKKEYSE